MRSCMMVRNLFIAAALGILMLAPDAIAQTPTCRPNTSKACPPRVPDRTITYSDPFKQPDPKSGRAKLADDGDGWNLPRIKLDNDTTLGVGGLERKF